MCFDCFGRGRNLEAIPRRGRGRPHLANRDKKDELDTMLLVGNNIVQFAKNRGSSTDANYGQRLCVRM